MRVAAFSSPDMRQNGELAKTALGRSQVPATAAFGLNCACFSQVLQELEAMWADQNETFDG